MKHLKEKMEDEVIQALSKSSSPESEGIKLIIEKMWSEERLAQFIDRRHHELCERCSRIAPIVQQGGMSKKEAAGIIGIVFALLEIIKALVGKLTAMCLLVAFALLAGCRVVEVENRGEAVVCDADGKPVTLADGRVQTRSLGWSVYHAQHWMITRADSLTASVKAGEIFFELNKLNSEPSSNVVVLVGTSLEGAGKIAGEIVEAVK